VADHTLHSPQEDDYDHKPAHRSPVGTSPDVSPEPWRPGAAQPALLRVGAPLGGIGVLMQVPMDRLHPHHSTPNDSAAAFREYAESQDWTIVAWCVRRRRRDRVPRGRCRDRAHVVFWGCGLCRAAGDPARDGVCWSGSSSRCGGAQAANGPRDRLGGRRSSRIGAGRGAAAAGGARHDLPALGASRGEDRLPRLSTWHHVRLMFWG